VRLYTVGLMLTYVSVVGLDNQESAVFFTTYSSTKVKAALGQRGWPVTDAGQGFGRYQRLAPYK
jgi:hypothetical protein